ncbi:MAG TPA: hypothetical protein VGR03_10090 [Candidatus Acidoferrum sp.]|nr:hypothetical protein [Candidatus Acidoferrum sp.]HVS75176.1 hypothetical protein [Candidatus Acidoferrales bacterium]
MNARAFLQVLTRAALVVCGVFVVVVLLAAMPNHRAPALPAQEQQPPPGQQTSSKTSKDDMGAMHHDHMATKDDSDEKQSEGNAVHDMMRGHHHGNGPHMHMTPPRPRTRADEERAERIAAELRSGIEKYKDYHAAFADGYKIFLPNIRLPEYHFTNYWNGFLEAFTFDPARPTSLLYKHTAEGYELVGAMYTMPKNATEEQLNARVPLSVASWHLHTNLCMPAHYDGARVDWTKFGLRGSISTEKACEAAGGRFRPSIFGWMIHVYPFEESPDKVFAH